MKKKKITYTILSLLLVLLHGVVAETDCGMEEENRPDENRAKVSWAPRNKSIIKTIPKSSHQNLRLRSDCGAETMLPAVPVATVHPHHLLRGGDDDEASERRLRPSWLTNLFKRKREQKKVNMCHIDQTIPTKFRTVKVSRNQVAKRLDLGDMLGTCHENCDSLCPGSTCDLVNGLCIQGACTPVQCPDDEICHCRCEDQDKPQRLLTWPRSKPKEVVMCEVPQMNPAKFRTVKVTRTSLKTRLAQGNMLFGRCCKSKNKNRLCPGMNCDEASGQCLPKVNPQEAKCTGMTSCPGQQCICECKHCTMIEHVAINNTATFDVLFLDGWEEEQVTWEVSSTSRITWFDLSLSTSDQNELLTVKSTFEDAVPTFMPPNTVGLLNISRISTPCLNPTMQLHVVIPSTVQSLCLSGSCRPVLCPLSYTFNPKSRIDLSAAPSNNEMLFGDSHNCTIVKPTYWDDFVFEYFGTNESTEAYYFDDPDGDGLSNIVEYLGPTLETTYNRNVSSNGRRLFVAPVVILPSGMNPTKSDSDGDLLTDAFEWKFGLDPLSPNDIDEDQDSDGLTLFEEQKHGTNPFSADTDGDGYSDLDEIRRGSDPQNDLSIPGNPGDAEQTEAVNVVLTVGDYSGSHSERYNLIVGSVTHQAPKFGVVNTATYTFKKGSHEIRIIHMGTKLSSPDYDYEARVVPDTSTVFDVAVHDPLGILGRHGESSYFFAEGKTATLDIKCKVGDKCCFPTCDECNRNPDCEWEEATKSCEEYSWIGDGFKDTPESCSCNKCKAWAEEELKDMSWVDGLPRCPCTVTVDAKSLRPSKKNPFFPGWDDDAICKPGKNCGYYHPEAIGCIRAAGPKPHGQQCCYDSTGSSFPHGDRSAGTPDKQIGNVLNWYDHRKEDVIPFDNCCKDCEIDYYCDYYVGNSSTQGARSDPRGCMDYCGSLDHLSGVGPLNPTLNRDISELSIESVKLSSLAYQENPLDVGYEYLISYKDDDLLSDDPDWAVLAKTKDGYCVAAFRGTVVNFVDWASNFDPFEEDICNECCEGDDCCCTARKGFVGAYFASYEQKLQSDLRNCAADCDKVDGCVVLSGHSQGGAIAQVASIAFADLNPYVFTFGSPPAVRSPCSLIQSDRHYRYINTIREEGKRKHDPTPFVPLAEHFGYAIVIGDEGSVAAESLDAQFDLQVPLDIDWEDLESFKVAAHYLDGYNGYIQQMETLSKSTFPLSTDGWELGSPCLLDFECKSGFCENYKCSGGAMFTFGSFIMDKDLLNADDIMAHHKLTIELFCNGGEPERISHIKEVSVNQFESSSTSVDEPVFQRLESGSLQVDWEGRLVDEDDGPFDDEIDWSYHRRAVFGCVKEATGKWRVYVNEIAGVNGEVPFEESYSDNDWGDYYTKYEQD